MLVLSGAFAETPRQHYHFNFCRLLQKLNRRFENSPRRHDLPDIAISEELRKIRLCLQSRVDGGIDFNLLPGNESAEIVA